MKQLLKISVGLAAIALTVAFAAESTKATPVTFTTTGTFSVGGTSTLTLGTNALTFTGVTNTANPMGGFTFVPFGMFTFANNTGSGTVPAGTTFTLTIAQVSPAGTGTVVATITGSVTVDNSTIIVDFGNALTGPFPNSITLPSSGPLTFTYSPISVAIGDPNTASGGTTLQGRVLETAIPEPASMILLGTGLVGLGAAVRRRFAK